MGLLSSIFGGGKDKQKTVRTQQLPREYRRGANFLIDRSVDLGRSQRYQTPELSQYTQEGMGLLSQEAEPFIENQYRQMATGQINPDLYASVSDAAQRSVGDRFAQAGRSGSPAEGISLGKTVSNALAPYAAQSQQTGLEGLLGLDRMQGQDLLTAGGIQDQWNQQRMADPYTELGLLQGPMGTALGTAPQSQVISEDVNRNRGAGILGGAVTGAKLGSGFGPVGSVIGGIGGGLLGGFF